MRKVEPGEISDDDFREWNGTVDSIFVGAEFNVFGRHEKWVIETWCYSKINDRHCHQVVLRDIRLRDLNSPETQLVLLNSCRHRFDKLKHESELLNRKGDML